MNAVWDAPDCSRSWHKPDAGNEPRTTNSARYFENRFTLSAPLLVVQPGLPPAYGTISRVIDWAGKFMLIELVVLPGTGGDTVTALCAAMLVRLALL